MRLKLFPGWKWWYGFWITYDKGTYLGIDFGLVSLGWYSKLFKMRFLIQTGVLCIEVLK